MRLVTSTWLLAGAGASPRVTPAEERVLGARRMLADGLFERFPKPDYALALHCSADMAHGNIGIVEGYALANVDSVDIVVKGVGGHGSMPHLAKDPVLLASQIVIALQGIVSREIKPGDPAVVTVGSIQGGAKHNIIPDQVELIGTVRSFETGIRDAIWADITRILRDNPTDLNVVEFEAEVSEEGPVTVDHPDIPAAEVSRFVCDRQTMRDGIRRLLAPGANVHASIRNDVMLLCTDPEHAADADTADAVVQFAVFGELVFG